MDVVSLHVTLEVEDSFLEADEHLELQGHIN